MKKSWNSENFPHFSWIKKGTPKSFFPLINFYPDLLATVGFHQKYTRTLLPISVE